MTEFNPSIVRIEKIEKHFNSNNLSIATVLGDYPVIIKTSDFQIGQLVSYIPIDTIVPDTEQFYFLCPLKYENYELDEVIKTRAIGPKYPLGSIPEKDRIIFAKKIRGVYSQGLVLPCPEGFNEGDSIVEHFNLSKWVEENEENVQICSRKVSGSNQEKAPIGWSIPYYDIESIRKFLSKIEPGEEVVLSEKLNGSNFSACYDGNKLHVKSRNFYKKENEFDMWWDAANRYNLKEKLSKYPMLVFFAELIGQVKGFRYDSEIIDNKLQTLLYFFDIYDVKRHCYLNYDDRVAILEELKLPIPPILYRGAWMDKESMYKLANGLTMLGGKHIREGWVLNVPKERVNFVDGRFQFKFVGEDYALSKGKKNK